MVGKGHTLFKYVFSGSVCTRFTENSNQISSRVKKNPDNLAFFRILFWRKSGGQGNSFFHDYSGMCSPCSSSY